MKSSRDFADGRIGIDIAIPIHHAEARRRGELASRIFVKVPGLVDQAMDDRSNEIKP
jgi:hypothetical protein